MPVRWHIIRGATLDEEESVMLGAVMFSSGKRPGGLPATGAGML